MAIFFVNQYSQALDLSDKSHLKLNTDGCKGLEKELKFDDKRAKFNNFVKLIRQNKSNRKVKERVAITTEWEATRTTPEQTTKFNDTFASSEVTTDKINLHYDRV